MPSEEPLAVFRRGPSVFQRRGVVLVPGVALGPRGFRGLGRGLGASTEPKIGMDAGTGFSGLVLRVKIVLSPCHGRGQTQQAPSHRQPSFP